MANAKKKGTPGTTNRKRSKANQIKLNKPVIQVPESQSITAAFQRASQGRQCPVCNVQLQNAVYQRHFENCQLQGNHDDDDEEIVFCGEVQGTPPQNGQPKNALKREIDESATLRDSVVVRKKAFGLQKQPQKEAPLHPFMFSAGEFLDRAEAAERKEKENAPEPVPKLPVDDLPLADVHGQCLAQLTTLLAEYEPKQQKQPQQRRRPSGANDKEKEDKDNDNSTLAIEPGCSSAQQQQVEEGEGGEEEEKPASGDEHEQPGQFDAHYALRFMWKIIQKVLLCPEHADSPEAAQLFWGDSLRTLHTFLHTSVRAQNLFVRLLIRKWGWQIARDINYPELGTNAKPVLALFAELRHNGLMEVAYSGAFSGAISVEEALKLVKMEDLKPLCLRLNLKAGMGRYQILEQLRSYATQKDVLGRVNKWHMFKCIKHQIGDCFRVCEPVLELFSAILTVYSPNRMDTKNIDPYQPSELSSQLMFTMLQQQLGELAFVGPTCLPHSLVGIYQALSPSMQHGLMAYVRAKASEQKLRALIDKKAFVQAWELAQSVREQFVAQYLEGQKPGIRPFLELPVYLRCFTPPWVFCRCLFHGVEAAQRLQKYAEAVEWLQFLLEKEEFKQFCVNSRGHWHHRLALNLESHLKERELAAEACMAGLQDPQVGPKDRLALQNRLEKLTNRLDRTSAGNGNGQKEKEQEELGHIRLEKLEKVPVVGKVLAKSLGDGRQNHFYMSSSGKATPSTLQQQPKVEGNAAANATVNLSSVEAVALRHFLHEEGFAEGVHSEGAIWHSLFRLFFHDIIFCHNVGTANVWISPLQHDPLDLNFPDFFTNRRHLVKERLSQILHVPSSIDHFLGLHLDRIRSMRATNSVIGWHHFDSDEQIQRLLRCCTPKLLHDLFERICTDFRNNRSGFPDLTLWNASTKQLAVVEVKGPNDQLSTKQQLWLDFFTRQGIRACVCHVTAKNDRALD